MTGACLPPLGSDLWLSLLSVISVVRLDKGNFAGAKLPRYEALRGERPPDLETTVILPESVFRGQWGPPVGQGSSVGHPCRPHRGQSPAECGVSRFQRCPPCPGPLVLERLRSLRSWHGGSGGTQS
jgi:hypothetical protein